MASRIRICFLHSSSAPIETRSASGDRSPDQGSAPSRRAARLSGPVALCSTALVTNLRLANGETHRARPNPDCPISLANKNISIGPNVVEPRAAGVSGSEKVDQGSRHRLSASRTTAAGGRRCSPGSASLGGARRCAGIRRCRRRQDRFPQGASRPTRPTECALRRGCRSGC